jgi:anti-sigma B factor antagonist
MPILYKAPARLDADQIKNIRIDFDRLATAADDVVVDMARTEVIDGSGVGAMVFAFKRLNVNGKRLSIRNVSGQPLNLLNDSGLLKTLSSERKVSRVGSIVRSLRLDRLLGAAKPVAQSAAVVTLPLEEERAKGAA